jgi:hypothetical protein
MAAGCGSQSRSLARSGAQEFKADGERAHVSQKSSVRCMHAGAHDVHAGACGWACRPKVNKDARR